MGWLWESEREERPRGSGLKLGGLAVLAGAAGFFLIGSKEPDPAAAPTAAAQLDCMSPRNAWRAACQPTTAEAPMPAVSETVEEAPKATGALPSKTTAKTALAKTVRTSSKPKPETAAPEGAQKLVEEASHVKPEEQPLPARTMAALDNPPKAEPATPSSPEPRVVQKASLLPQAGPKRVERAPRREPATAERASEEPARLARHRAKPVASASAESSRPAPQAMKPAPESRPARPRVRDTGEGFAGFRRHGAETVALPDGRRMFIERGPREAFAGRRDTYRASQWKVTTYRDPIDW